MAALEIRLFGALSLLSDGQPLTRLPSRRGNELLAYLLLNRHTLHARERLAGLFWGDSDDQKARHCLNTTLWRLQGILGLLPARQQSYLKVDPRHIGFNLTSDFHLDVAEFETRCAWAEQLDPEAIDQQAFLLRQAITFYRADLLPNCYEEWCLVERERLQNLYLRALGRLLAYHVAHDERDAAIDCARRILSGDPLREEVHRELIQIYLATGQHGAALRQYRACEEVLRRELTVAPMPETQALLTRMLAATPPARRTVGLADSPPAIVLATGLPHDLAVAIARLHDASLFFDQAQEQLREATGLLKHLAQQYERAAPGTAVRAAAQVGQPHGAAELRQALRLVTGAMQQLKGTVAIGGGA